MHGKSDQPAMDQPTRRMKWMDLGKQTTYLGSGQARIKSVYKLSISLITGRARARTFGLGLKGKISIHMQISKKVKMHNSSWIRNLEWSRDPVFQRRKYAKKPNYQSKVSFGPWSACLVCGVGDRQLNRCQRRWRYQTDRPSRQFLYLLNYENQIWLIDYRLRGKR